MDLEARTRIIEAFRATPGLWDKTCDEFQKIQKRPALKSNQWIQLANNLSDSGVKVHMGGLKKAWTHMRLQFIHYFDPSQQRNKKFNYEELAHEKLNVVSAMFFEGYDRASITPKVENNAEVVVNSTASTDTPAFTLTPKTENNGEDLKNLTALDGTLTPKSEIPDSQETPVSDGTLTPKSKIPDSQESPSVDVKIPLPQPPVSTLGTAQIAHLTTPSVIGPVASEEISTSNAFKKSPTPNCSSNSFTTPVSRNAVYHPESLLVTQPSGSTAVPTPSTSGTVNGIAQGDSPSWSLHVASEESFTSPSSATSSTASGSSQRHFPSILPKRLASFVTSKKKGRKFYLKAQVSPKSSVSEKTRNSNISTISTPIYSVSDLTASLSDSKQTPVNKGQKRKLSDYITEITPKKSKFVTIKPEPSCSNSAQQAIPAQNSLNVGFSPYIKATPLQNAPIANNVNIANASQYNPNLAQLLYPNPTTIINNYINSLYSPHFNPLAPLGNIHPFNPQLLANMQLLTGTPNNQLPQAWPQMYGNATPFNAVVEHQPTSSATASEEPIVVD